jgi:hypothetical protein
MEGLVDHARPSVKVEKNRRSACNESGAKQGRDRFRGCHNSTFPTAASRQGLRVRRRSKGQDRYCQARRTVSRAVADKEGVKAAAQYPRLTNSANIIPQQFVTPLLSTYGWGHKRI